MVMTATGFWLVLVLSVTDGADAGGARTMQIVPETYSSIERCVRAGTEWAHFIKTAHSNSAFVKPSFACVPK